MTVSTSVHSNAFNFASYVNNGPDSRTGLCTQSVTLPALRGNDLLGPDFELALRYSPLNLQDTGYGKGWNLQLSQFDPDPQRRIVSLDSGETYKVTGRLGATQQLTMHEKKIDSFHLYEESDSRWRLVHRSGRVEILESQGSSGKRLALPVQVFNEQGQWIKFEYTNFDNGFAYLSKVTDMRGETLLQIARESALVTLTFQTDTGSASYAMRLVDADRKVGSIELPTDNKAGWRFKYSRQRNLDCISQVRTPTGGFEEMFYEDGGHLFPIGSGLEPLPRVTRHLIHPGHGQPSIDTRYTYSKDQHNFLGGNAVLPWQNDGLDNLFRQVIDYDYGTTETLWVDGKPVRSIERTFNKFHLVTREATYHGSLLSDDGKTVVGDHLHEVSTGYNLIPDRTFAEQPKYCQLPHGVETQWSLKSNPTHLRKEVTSSAYDDYGNLTRQTAANGIEQTYTWYSQIEAGFPGDAEGFVRHLKEKTETPASGHMGNVAARTNRYTYQRLPVLNASGASMLQDHWLAMHTDTSASGGDLKSVTTSYWEAQDETVQPSAPMVHGRIHTQVTAFPEPNAQAQTFDTRTEFTYSFGQVDWHETASVEGQRDRSHMLALKGASVLQMDQALRGYDGATKTLRTQLSRATGQVLLSHDDNDVEILNLYDSLRRVTHEVVSPGKPEEAERRYEYQLCANEDDQATQTQFDVKGVQTVAYFDGMHRTVSEARDDAAQEWSSGGLKPIYRANHDAWGNLISETEIDWFKGAELSLTNQMRYDAWGAQLCVITPDGVAEFSEQDPIGDGQTGPIVREWRQQLLDEQGAEIENGQKTAVTETQFNLFESPTRIRRLAKKAPGDEQETLPMSEKVFEYDGFGRKAKEITGLVAASKQSEAFTYDAFDRLLTHQLRENEVVVRSYAPHSDADLPVSIKVNDVLLGEQAFDGIDRMVESITGGRSQTYDYLPGQMQPCTVVTPTGAVEYEYVPHLSDQPVRRTLGGKEASYRFDKQNARLEHCSEVDGQAFSRTYFSTGEVKVETRGEFEMAYAYSLRGRQESYVDVMGQTQDYGYDVHGRLIRTSLGSLQSEFTYDALGHTASYTTAESDEGGHVINALTTTLAYDDLEREISRTFTFSDGSEQVLAQTYDDFDRIISRTLRDQTTTLRDETYKYDTRGRLTTYECTGDACPVDPYGKQISKQVFRFDALDNIKQVLTQFDGGSNNAIYHFENQDPVQLSRITNNGGAPYPAEIKLEYDANGNLTRDDAARSLEYDALNRLTRVTDAAQVECIYGYDPLNILSSTDSTA